MASQLQQKLAAFRNNQMKLQTKAVEDANRKARNAVRAKERAAQKAAAAAAAKATTTDSNKSGPPAKRQAALGKKLKDVVEWLRTEREPRSAAEILAGTQIDVQADQALAEALRTNPKINVSDGLFEYKSLHEIRNAEELLTALGAAGERGLVQSDVADSYKGVVDDITRLRAEEKLYAVHNHDLRDFVLYTRDDKLDTEVAYSSELAAIWQSVADKIPMDPAELERQLQAAGVAVAQRDVTRKRTALPPKERKRRARAVRLDKVTNAHMPELFQGAAPTQID